ncbi:MAG: DNA-directed RNA polymerase subunit beta'' [Candidatus Sericytochromatia bacterium]|nr:DNA-directed RNA polymerase subunit beta'' [Candidatus Sericytochromatia bacterium]
MSSRFDYIKVGIASPERILSWSRGEVTKPETINYRTLKPERDGLFCEKIFGPAKDWECHCGKYKRVRHKGIICERCGVEVTDSKVRRYRMGHIQLAAPVVHIWYLKGIPSYLSQLLDIPLKNLENVVYFNEYIVLDPGTGAIDGKALEYGQTINEDQYEEFESKEAVFTAKMGAEAIKELLDRLDLPAERERLQVEAESTSETKRLKAIKRLRVVDAFLSAGARPAWMVLDVIPVIPPDLRPMVQLDGGRFATSDLNDLYRRVINRNNRLRRLKDMGAPDIIVRNEKRMLQEAVDALIDNGRRGRAVVGPSQRALKSLSDIIEGKQGRFRQNLLGKRVDYSGRSVIVVGPSLKLHQCGLPKEMALELFKPFVMNKLVERGIVQNIKSAKKKIERGETIVWDILEEVIRNHPVLLNRAPTLHRLGIQAFEPLLVEGRAIQIHPLVCTAFNADFDGDQMAVHVPLSVEAQTEARLLMLASNNVLSPATGKPVITPTQDMVLGSFYLTVDNPEAIRGRGMVFKSFSDALAAYAEGRDKNNHHAVLDLHAPIVVRFDGPREEAAQEAAAVAEFLYPGAVDGEQAEDGFVAPPAERRQWLEGALGQRKVIVTTVGRIILNQVLPEEFPFMNKVIDKKGLERIIQRAFSQMGSSRAALLANELKDLGFHYATRAGVSIAIADLVVPTSKKALLSRADAEIEKAQADYLRGTITEVERYTKVIDTWASATEELKGKVKEEYDRLNSVYMMAFSGARGNITQVSQLVCMRGLMADPSGRIIDLPIKSNFREGLNQMEYIISSYGARKGIIDTALRTADSGYLTRRLADVAQDVIVRDEDCGTSRGLELRAITEGDRVVVPMADRAVGRVLAAAVVDGEGVEVFKVGHILGFEDVERLASTDVEQILIRSPLTCESQRGVCRKCYGWSLTSHQLVDIGEAVGIIAAQSIGEPGTQLTMRTFHTGGVFTAEATTLVEKASKAGKVRFPEPFSTREFRTKHGDRVQVTDREGIIEVLVGGKVVETIQVGVGFVLDVEDGSVVEPGRQVAYSLLEMRGASRKSMEQATKEIDAEVPGMLCFQNFGVEEKTDRQGNTTRTAVPLPGKAGESIVWVVEGDVFPLPKGASIKVRSGQMVEKGDVIAETDLRSQLGGTLRMGADVVTERTPAGQVIRSGRSVEVVTADLVCEGYTTGTKEAKFRIDDEDGTQRLFSLKFGGSGSRVESDQVVAEHVDDEDLVQLAGEIRYVGEPAFLDKDRRTFGKQVKLLFIPEERITVNKDVSLLVEGIRNGAEVAAGTEVVRDIEVKTNGVLHIFEDNNIIKEVYVFPGDRYEVPLGVELEVEDGQMVPAGTALAEGVVARQGGVVRLIPLSDGDEPLGTVIVVRKTVERVVRAAQKGIPFVASSEDISLQYVTRLQVKDGERVKVGTALAKTEVALRLTGTLARLTGRFEMEEQAPVEEGGEPQPNGFRISILEPLTLRRDLPSMPHRAGHVDLEVVTYLMAEDGVRIDPGTVVVRSEIRSHAAGMVEEPRVPADGLGPVSRLALVTSEQEVLHEVPRGTSAVVDGEFVREGHDLGGGVLAKAAGRVRLDGDRVVVRKARPYLISAGTQLIASDGDMVMMGEPLAMLIYNRQKTGDIIQGLPRVEELLEARKPKDNALLAPHAGVIDLDKDPEDAAEVRIIADRPLVEGEPMEEVPQPKTRGKDKSAQGITTLKVPASVRLIVSRGERVERGQPLTDGPVSPKDVLAATGSVEVTQRFLVEEVQMVYRSQGVEIADKHLEVIVRQMTRKVKVDETQASKLLPGEMIDSLEAERINQELLSEGKPAAKVSPELLGITKASLNTDSFVSAASFQETTRVLTEAAIAGKKDFLHGLKENVVIGRLIPAGTGYFDPGEEPESVGAESAIIGGVPSELLGQL